jgi:hypothetical protein
MKKLNLSKHIVILYLLHLLYFREETFVDQLPAIKDELKQLANINDVTIFYEADVSEWTAKMVAWQNDVSKTIARATAELPIFCKVSSPTSSMVFRR